MNIQQFVIESFEKIKNLFPHALIEYQYDEDVDTHYIKLSPLGIYEDDSFVDIGWAIKDTYNEIFDSGDVCFLTDKSLIQLTAPTIISDPETNIASVNDIETIIEAGELLRRFDTLVEFDWKESETVIVLDSFQSNLEVSDINSGNDKYAMAA